MSTTRRVFFYLVTIITLGIAAAGVGQLLSLVFDLTLKAPSAPEVGRAGFIQQQLSLGLVNPSNTPPLRLHVGMVAGPPTPPLWVGFGRVPAPSVRQVGMPIHQCGSQ